MSKTVMIPQSSPDAIPVPLGADFKVQYASAAHPLSGNRPALVIECRDCNISITIRNKKMFFFG